MSSINTALPLPPREYDLDYMNRLVRQLNLALLKMNTTGPLQGGSDLSNTIKGHPISALTLIDIPTSSANLPSGSVWSDGGVLKIVS